VAGFIRRNPQPHGPPQLLRRLVFRSERDRHPRLALFAARAIPALEELLL